MIISIAWKNIWRNKVRSLVVIFALIVGIFGAIMLVGIMEGWVTQRTHDVIFNEVSHIQIHNPEYLNNEEIIFTINDFPEVKRNIEKQTDIIAWCVRTKMFCMAQSDWSSSGLIIKGVNPEEEIKVSEINQSLIEGKFLTDNGRLPSIVIGENAAQTLKLVNWEVTEEKLNNLDSSIFDSQFKLKLENLKGKRFRIENDFKKTLKKELANKEFDKYSSLLIKHFKKYRLRSKITVTLQSAKGQFVYYTFRVMGIYKTSNTAFDALNAFADINIIKEATGLGPDDYHEIGIICSDKELALQTADELRNTIKNNEVQSWKVISPEIALYSDFMKIMDYIYVSIFLLALSFGIINTMLMSVLERTKELGMLMAIGMNKRRVFNMIMFESVLLTLTGAAFGMIISGITIMYYHNAGINLSMWAEGFEAIGYASIIYPSLGWDVFLGITALVILTGIISSIWPARKALKLNPAEAIRSE